MIIDVLDMVHPDVKELQAALEKTGSTILRYFGMCNGVGQMVTDVMQQAAPRSLEALRIWSHGVPGGQGVSTGPSSSGISPRGLRAGISLRNLHEVEGSLAQLTPCFAPGARVELRGCEVGVGVDGDALLRKLARLWGVPVYAALNAQPIGPVKWVGPVMKATPDGSVYPTSGLPVQGG